MPRAQHDRQRQGEQDQQDEQRDRDAEATARLGRIRRGGQRRGRFGGLPAAVAREHVLLVDLQRAGISAQEAAHEHVRRQVGDLVGLELMQDAHGDARGLRELGHGDVPLLPFPS